MTEKREPTLLQAFIPVVFLIILLFVNVGLFGDNALDGSNQIILTPIQLKDAQLDHDLRFEKQNDIAHHLRRASN